MASCDASNWVEVSITNVVINEKRISIDGLTAPRDCLLYNFLINEKFAAKNILRRSNIYRDSGFETYVTAENLFRKKIRKCLVVASKYTSNFIYRVIFI